MTAQEIIAAVARKHGFAPSQLKRNTRIGRNTPEIVRARDEAIAAVRRELHFSFPLIARIFGGFDHTTIMSALQRFGDRDVSFERRTIHSRVEILEAQVKALQQRLADQRPEGF